MPKEHAKAARKGLKSGFYTSIRTKMGLSQEEFASIFGLSRRSYSLIEGGHRDMPIQRDNLIVQMSLQFLELEKGIQANYRSLETRLFLNGEYKWNLDQMRTRENDCRRKMKGLSAELERLKLAARDANHAIIVASTAIRNLEESETGPALKAEYPNVLKGLERYKKVSYDRLLTCWEPVQAKLQAKYEALAGEAKALRSFRLKIIKEQGLGKR
ncbi:MAG: XRE family transcriptional regulator [Chitinophagaceae bacterium]|nr:MAG: XRE family transcriptional regulator [Chitinophagaceae bacterium]